MAKMHQFRPPDPNGELIALPDFPAGFNGPILLRGGRGEEWRGKDGEKKRRELGKGTAGERRGYAKIPSVHSRREDANKRFF